MGNFFATGTRVFFACDDGISGREPWVYDPSTAGVAFVLPYGKACNGSSGAPSIGAIGLPSLGNASFAITLANALPQAFVFQTISFAPGNIQFSSSCRQLVAYPVILGATLFTDANGFASVPFAIPNAPAYLGLNLFYQWAIVDPAGGIFGTFAASNALQVVLGT